MSLKLQFGMCSDELFVGRSVADPVPVGCYDIRLCTVDSAPRQTNLQARDSVFVNRKTANAKTSTGGRAEPTVHQDVKIPDYYISAWHL